MYFNSGQSFVFEYICHYLTFSRYAVRDEIIFPEIPSKCEKDEFTKQWQSLVRVHFWTFFCLSCSKTPSWNYYWPASFFRLNENVRRAERRVEFDIEALARAVCHSTRRLVSDLPSITKFAEGGFNHVLQATFSDGYSVIARIPYYITVPKGLMVASEAATLGLLWFYNIPVPKVLGYSQNHNNPVRTEYLLLEKLDRVPLSDQ